MDRETLDQGWTFLEELVKAGGMGNQHEIGKAHGWDFDTGEFLTQWLEGEGFVHRSTGGDTEVLLAGRMWLKTASLREARAAAGRQTSVELNQTFEGTVGAVMTGNGASATVVQNVYSDGQKVALASLEMFASLVKDLQNLPEREALLSLVAQGQLEVRKASPDATKLSTVAGAIASTIQTTASLQGAWAAVQHGFRLIGVG